jgi:hypothetical protein
VLMGTSISRYGAAFRTLPGVWSPPLSEAIQRQPRQPLENAELFMVLVGLLLLRGTRDVMLVITLGLVVECVSILLFPRLVRYFNATTMLYILLGFLLLRGYFESGSVAIIVTIIVGCLHGSLLWGMIPAGRNKLWQVHLVCFLGGGIIARFIDAISALLPHSALW